ncbi:OLD family endonuclease [Gluconobacter potus]|uniref:OLD family endonuclease n=1 Tax=Gluconobacter potus TaxID=2724927 RepID=A0A149QZP3_9PROT|nr:OLD family endonuclease [Gluconobacter potus]
MKLASIRVEGFRLLENIEITIEQSATVIVGRNNSGKTSLTEIFEKFLGDPAGQFCLEDFSATIRPQFITAKALRDADAPAEEVLAALPKIALQLTFCYAPDAADFGPLSPFIIDLNPNCTTALARVEYAASLNSLTGLLEVPLPEAGVDANHALFRHLRNTIAGSYVIKLTAIDPTDASNWREFDKLAPLLALIQTGYVKAQRTLDVSKRGDTDVIGKILSKLFRTANALGASEQDQAIANQLKASVAQLEQSMQGDFDEKLEGLLPALNSFGFPSLNDTQLRPQTTINVEDVLKENTRILYTGADGVHLPEGYNGLGTRNLIYILLQLEALHKAYRGAVTRPGTHLVFIEEPEAHLHPQMQEVFIAQLNEAIATLSQQYPEELVWQVQFIVSTHSSHLANAAQFGAIRYFLNEQTAIEGVRRTQVKDFRKGAEKIRHEDQAFLQQYMTLTKCDLYFADKAILVEGATERILMPRIVKLVDAELEVQDKLARQYITTMEVGGAYAQIFYPLLSFLELKTLIITDLDAVKLVGEKYKKCPCCEGERTSNSAIKAWFKDNAISIETLQGKTEAQKTKGFVRIAYQTPEDGSEHCARSYEDAFVLANLELFGILDDADAATCAWDTAKGFGKSEQAIKYAIMEEDWNVPRYIKEGLRWLSEPSPPPEAATAMVPGDDAEAGVA